MIGAGVDSTIGEGCWEEALLIGGALIGGIVVKVVVGWGTLTMTVGGGVVVKVFPAEEAFSFLTFFLGVWRK